MVNVNPTKEEIESWYVDQAYESVKYHDRNFFHALTPWGIRLLDGEFCKEIKNLTNVSQGRSLRKRIVENIHLHQGIKNNLLLNLDNQLTGIKLKK